MGRWDATQAEESRGFASGGGPGEFYSVRAEGSAETLTATPGITPADWDGAVDAAQVAACATGRSHVIRVHAGTGSRVIATLTPDGTVSWARMMTWTMRDAAGQALIVASSVARDQAGHALSCPRDHDAGAECPVVTEQRTT